MDLLIGCRVICKFHEPFGINEEGVADKGVIVSTNKCMGEYYFVVIFDDGKIGGANFEQCEIDKEDIKKIKNRAKKIRKSISSRFDLMEME